MIAKVCDRAKAGETRGSRTALSAHLALFQFFVLESKSRSKISCTYNLHVIRIVTMIVLSPPGTQIYNVHYEQINDQRFLKITLISIYRFEEKISLRKIKRGFASKYNLLNMILSETYSLAGLIMKPKTWKRPFFLKSTLIAIRVHSTTITITTTTTKQQNKTKTKQKQTNKQTEQKTTRKQKTRKNKTKQNNNNNNNHFVVTLQIWVALGNKLTYDLSLTYLKNRLWCWILINYNCQIQKRKILILILN